MLTGLFIMDNGSTIRFAILNLKKIPLRGTLMISMNFVPERIVA